MAFHYGGETTTAEEVRREVAQAEVDDVRAALRRFVPAANGRHRSVCGVPVHQHAGRAFPDRPSSQWKNVLIASPCSGHGFKFAPVIGEILADLVQGKPPRFDLGALPLALR